MRRASLGDGVDRVSRKQAAERRLDVRDTASTQELANALWCRHLALFSHRRRQKVCIKQHGVSLLLATSLGRRGHGACW